MDFNHNQIHTPSRPQPEQFTPVPSPRGKKKRLSRIVSPGRDAVVSWSLVLIVLILIAFGLLWLFHVNSYNEAGEINKSEYQAIFLNNGQVYFGHLKTLNPQYAKLTDIFYLQVQNQVQPNQNTSDQNQNVHLVKLGNELHGPEDAMQINRDQIVFWENLKPTGKVTEAINTYYKNGGSASGSSAPAATTNSTATTPSSTSSNTNTSTTTGNSSTTATGSSTPKTTRP